jgi:hypothetical protein
MTPIEFEAGPGQVLAVYEPEDIGAEVDPEAIYSAVAADAATRASRGQRIVAMTTLPSRHAGVAFGRTGSGYETKVTVTVVYAMPIER